MRKRSYRGKLIPVKKGGVNIQLCAYEKKLLMDVLYEVVANYENKLKAENNRLWRRDLTYYKKIYSKLTHRKQCVHCGLWA